MNLGFKERVYYECLQNPSTRKNSESALNLLPAGLNAGRI
ncbi:hypothetical protein MNV_930002 [Candidatus Methanoperedens nitroreducens]|uniref:Uncharacterized protein n=1 Tax=Candidatus Methanoperedens nitratireducens TaxID=1392998 RepID=A0A284VUA3_9EURY|nr:hypothetical protein MNV_930002 [Candidatus Methanoperedens nitroreducens]